mgnify:CR=1 FL=1
MTDPTINTCLPPCAKCELRSGRPHRLRRAGLRSFVAFSQRIGGPALDIERARLFWDEPRGPAGGLVYVALGDSIAQGRAARAHRPGHVVLLPGSVRSPGAGRVSTPSGPGARLTPT